MKLVILILSVLCVFVVKAQHLQGSIIDVDKETIPSVKLNNTTKGLFKLSNTKGIFKIKASPNDTIYFYSRGFDTTTLIISQEDLENNSFEVVLLNPVQIIGEAHVIRNRLADFDVGYLPPIRGVQITTGTNTMIELSKLNGAKSTANPREIFAKVPGLNIWESDGSGIQIGIGGRGLSPNRAANFNTRQNGYDISADALGYPESYYTPPIEALKSIEIIRGSASLQFGTQFGGLLNFVIKDPPVNSPFEFTTRNTAGTYGYLGSFNRIAGSVNRFSYQVYYQHKRGNGYRDNSEFNQQQLFAQAGYYVTENIKLRLEYTHMDYLAHQAGGLTDLQFNADPKVSLRDRNWFNVDWNILALHYDQKFSNKAHFNVRAFGMKSARNTLGFLGKITQADHNDVRDMISGKFQNAGIEARYLRRYSIFKDTSKIDFRGAFLVGGRYYQGNSTAEQGLATDGDQADFNFQNSDDLENSSYSFPSENIAGFAENIFFLGKRWTFNFGARFENISSSSEGYYKQYVIHPINNDTIAIINNSDSKSVKRVVPLFGGGAGAQTQSTSSTGLFGGGPSSLQTPSSNAGGLFSSQQQPGQPSSLFGGMKPATGGGLFGSAPGTGGGLQLQQQPAQQAPSLFGGAGGLGGGGLFSQQGQQQQQGQSLFGQQQQQNQVPSSPYGAQLPVPNAGALVPASSSKPRQSLLGDAGVSSHVSRSTASALATFPSRPQTPRAPWLQSRGATSGAKPPSSHQKAVVLSRREHGGSGMPTYLDKPSHDAYEIAQPEGGAVQDGIGRKDSPANGWLFKPREDPRALFIRPTSTLIGNGKEGLSGISLATYGNGKASSPRDQRLSLPFVDEDSGITISPTLDELRDLVEKRGPEALTCVENFSVTDKEFGKVEWLEPVDVSRLDVARVVKFEKACLYLYPEDAGVEAPETGKGLKKSAMVTLTGIKPRKGTAAAKKRYEEKIESQTKAAGGELVSYDADVGEWKFSLHL